MNRSKRSQQALKILSDMLDDAYDMTDCNDVCMWASNYDNKQKSDDTQHQAQLPFVTVQVCKLGDDESYNNARINYRLYGRDEFVGLAGINARTALRMPKTPAWRSLLLLAKLCTLLCTVKDESDIDKRILRLCESSDDVVSSIEREDQLQIWRRLIQIVTDRTVKYRAFKAKVSNTPSVQQKQTQNI